MVGNREAVGELVLLDGAAGSERYAHPGAMNVGRALRPSKLDQKLRGFYVAALDRNGLVNCSDDRESFPPTFQAS